MTNHELANRLRQHATELAHQGSNLYRVRAIRQAAVNLLGATREAQAVLVEEGPRGLQREFHIGASVAQTIHDYLQNAELALGNQAK